jgi:hypothetical protein
MCGWNPMQCEWGSRFFVCLGGFIPIMWLWSFIFHVSENSPTNYRNPSSKQQHTTLVNLCACFHVYGFVSFDSVGCRSNNAWHDWLILKKCIWNNVWACRMRGPCETFEKSLIQKEFINLVDRFNNFFFLWCKYRSFIKSKILTYNNLFCKFNLKSICFRLFIISKKNTFIGGRKNNWHNVISNVRKVEG